jgi:hypothetical protein
MGPAAPGKGLTVTVVRTFWELYVKNPSHLSHLSRAGEKSLQYQAEIALPTLAQPVTETMFCHRPHRDIEPQRRKVRKGRKEQKNEVKYFVKFVINLFFMNSEPSVAECERAPHVLLCCFVGRTPCAPTVPGLAMFFLAFLRGASWMKNVSGDSPPLRAC